MGNCVGNCVFRCGYTLYADTCIGRCIHNKYIDTFRKQFGDRAIHSKLTPFVFGRLKFTALLTPGHTKGHIVWWLHGDEFGISDSVFSGDHLMLAGCGAAFEGTLKQMIASLEIVSNLSNDTMVWPGHEMGLENLELASFVEPDNVGAMLKLVWAVNRRDRMLCTCPSTIGEEKLFNPFLRTKEESLWKALGIYNRIKNSHPPLSQDDVGVLCFEHIVRKSAEMRKLKQEMKRLEIQRRTKAEVGEQFQSRQSVQAVESHSTVE